jgi:predicted permease
VRWLARWRRGGRDADIADEIATHLEMAIAERVARGEPPDAARAAALREFGNVALVKQTTREVWSWTTLEQLLQDARFGARILWHAPGISLTAILLVALVIGANTTVYSMVHGILTAPASGVTAERLVCVAHASPLSQAGPFVSYPNYLDYAARSQTVPRLAAWAGERLTIGIEGATYAVFGAAVTANLFDVLGVRMTDGRAFRTDDDTGERGLTVVISDRLWRDRFRARPDISGQPVIINGRPATVIGVAAPRFLGVNLTPGEDVWMPITVFHDAMGRRELLARRGDSTLAVVGQLLPDASLAEARAEFATLSDQLLRAYPDDNKESRAILYTYSASALLPVAELGPRFLAIFSVVTLLTLLVVSANVANLMLARAVVRQRETAVRQSLGASRARVLRMLIAEGAAVSLVAWAAACVFAWWTSRLLVRLLPPARESLVPDTSPDWTVAAYAMVLAMLATLAFTTAPALRTWRQQVLPWLKAGEQAVAPGRSRLSSGLVVLQLAFSVLLATTAALAYRSLSLLDSGDVGFQQDHVLIMSVRTGRNGYRPPDAGVSAAERAQTFAILERVRERLRAVPDVDAVSYARRAPGPYFPGQPAPIWRAGHPDPIPGLRRPVGPHYFETLGLAPLAGRGITEADRHGAPRSAVINQHLAAALFGGQSPIGQQIYVGEKRDAFEIVGVTPNALYDGPTHNARPHFIFTAEQQLDGLATSEPRFFVRSRGSLDVIAPALAKAVAEVDAQAPVVAIQTMTAALESVTEIERMIATLLVFFAVASLIVAALGQYAMTTFNMQRRTRDFGVRMALGASARQIQHSVVAETLRLTGVGLLIGFAISIGLGAAFRSVLFGVTPTDPPTYLGVSVILGLASVVAAYLPAWRAGRVNVVEALRQE